jgi:hypothetical protein
MSYDMGAIAPAQISSGALEEICSLPWDEIDQPTLMAVARAYYYFSVQFRENLQIACELFPDDDLLDRLAREECATGNLSPWPGIAEPGEQMDHDEFMRRALTLSPLSPDITAPIDAAGARYLARVRAIDLPTRAASIPQYEDGGLEAVFRAILGARDWDTPLLKAFRHFLVCHIEFDSDPEQGHGALSRHIGGDRDVEVLWQEFLTLLYSIPGFKA